MDILLLVITIVSLLIAAFLGLAAWGMWREERARSAARIAALAAAAADEGQLPDDVPLDVNDVRLMPAQKAPLWSAPAPRQTTPLAQATEPRRHAPVLSAVRPAVESAVGDKFLGSAVAAPASSGRQRGLAVAAAVLFVALLAGAYFTIYDGRDSQDSATTAANITETPLELISLRHERDKGALAITGLVRNPNGAARLDKLDAVALLFDQQGAFVTSSRVGVDFTQLAPGDESPFVIRVDAPATVARYRVSFRTEAGVVPHVDRRGQEPIARDLP
jgi:hypothetical protein